MMKKRVVSILAAVCLLTALTMSAFTHVEREQEKDLKPVSVNETQEAVPEGAVRISGKEGSEETTDGFGTEASKEADNDSEETTGEADAAPEETTREAGSAPEDETSETEPEASQEKGIAEEAQPETPQTETEETVPEDGEAAETSISQEGEALEEAGASGEDNLTEEELTEDELTDEKLTEEELTEEDLKVTTETLSASDGLTTPVLVSLTSAGSRSMTLTWEAVKGAEGYEVLRCSPKDSAYVSLARVSANQLSYTDTTCENGLAYQYTVRAYTASLTGTAAFGLYGRTAYDLPTVYNCRAASVTTEGFTLTGNYVSTAGISYMTAAVWTVNGGQDDLAKIQMTAENGMLRQDGSFSLSVRVMDHLSESGEYVIHIHSYDVNGEKNPEVYYLSITVPDPLPVLTGASAVNAGASGFDVSVMVSAPAGVKNYAIRVWTDASTRSNAVSAENVRLEDGLLTGHVNTAAVSGDGPYHVLFTLMDTNGKKTSCTIDFSCLSDPETELKITTVNTGSGDCQLISSRGSHLMIDAGLDEDKVDETIRVLRQNGVTHLTVLITHNHLDHLAGLAFLSDLFTIDRVYLPTHISDCYMDQIGYEKIVQKLRGKGIELMDLPPVGTVLPVGDARIEVLYQQNEELYVDSSCNNSCIWLGITCGDFRYLTGGDAERLLESQILSFLTGSYDMIKLDHHGENTSNSTAFLTATGAHIAVVSSGIHNRGLVAGKVIEGVAKARNLGFTVFDTYECGSITSYIMNGLLQTLIANTGEPYYLAIDSVTVSDVTKDGYRVTVKFTSSEGVASVRMPTWSDENGQDDLKWLNAEINDDTATCYVKASDFKTKSGGFTTHVYVYDTTGKSALKGTHAEVPAASSGSGSSGETEETPYDLSIREVEVTDVTTAGYTVKVTFNATAGVSKVLMPTWSEVNGQDDLKWCEAAISGNTASYTVKVSDFKAASGKYITHVYVYDKLGKYVIKGTSAEVPKKESSSGGTGEYALSIDGITVSDVTSKGYTITVRFTSSAGVSKVLMPTWSDENGQDDPKWCEASISGSEASYTVKVSDFKAAYGKYITHVYVYDKLGKYVLKGVNVTVPGEDPADEGGNGSGENGSQSGSGENGEQNGSGEESWVYQGVDYSLVFDADYYLTHYPDLKKVYGNDHQKAFSHFIRHGMREGRQGSAIFNVNVYRSRYADLNAAFGNQLERYYLHFINNGYKENRKAV